MGFFKQFFVFSSRESKLEKDNVPSPETAPERPAPDDDEPGPEGDGGEPSHEEAANEPEQEQTEEKRFDISTVADFIHSLEWSYDEARRNNDEDLKRKLAHQIIKIRAGLNTAGLAANKVMVKQAEPGVLGMYEPHSGKISAAKALLDDFNADETLFRTVFLHEKTHADGIADEGLTQLRVGRKIQASSGIYEREMADTERLFYREAVDKCFDVYDLERPEELVDYYLEAELNGKFTDKKLQELAAHKKFDRAAEETAGEYNNRFKKALPRLHEKLQSGYFKKAVKEILEQRMKVG